MNTTITSILHFFERQTSPAYYDKEDKLSSIFSALAMEETQLGHFDNLKSILNSPRFNGYCAKEFFTLFFNRYKKRTHPDMIGRPELEQNMLKGFEIFLASEKLNFSLLYSEYRHEYYYFLEEESDADDIKLTYINLFCDYILKHHIYISAIAKEFMGMVNLIDDENNELSIKLLSYVNIAKHDEQIIDFIYICGNSVSNTTDAPAEYLLPELFTERTKNAQVHKMFGLALMFNSHAIIRLEDNQKNEPSLSFLNTPYTNFEKCCHFLNSSWGFIFTEEEIDLIVKTFYIMYNNYYKI